MKRQAGRAWVRTSTGITGNAPRQFRDQIRKAAVLERVRNAGSFPRDRERQGRGPETDGMIVNLGHGEKGGLNGGSDHGIGHGARTGSTTISASGTKCLWPEP